jgi:hypothetical protein
MMIAPFIWLTKCKYIYPCCKTLVYSECHMFHNSIHREYPTIGDFRSTSNYNNDNIEHIHYFCQNVCFFDLMHCFNRKHAKRSVNVEEVNQQKRISVYRSNGNNKLMKFENCTFLQKIHWCNTKLNDYFQCWKCGQSDYMTWFPYISRNKCAFCIFCETYYRFQHQHFDTPPDATLE